MLKPFRALPLPIRTLNSAIRFAVCKLRYRVDEMSTPGTFQEDLGDGGTLRVYATAWEVQYYFPGPDRRYNGTFVTYKDSEIPKLIDAYQWAYLRYQALKKSVVKGAELTISGTMGLTIRVGGRYWEGVCMNGYQSCVRDEESLKRKLQAYQRALERGPQLQKVLQGLR
jgi:hypothetical protein